MIDKPLRDAMELSETADDYIDTTSYVSFEKTRLSFSKDTPRGVWSAVLLKLRDAERSVQWWIGDAMAYGELHYGESAFADLERQDKTLANWATVARKVHPSRRREDVRFSHHAEVASLPPEQQTEVLERVSTEDLTVSETRDLVRQEQQSTAEREFGKAEVVPAPNHCEHCGAPEWAWERSPNG